jgi:hypothetical protein
MSPTTQADSAQVVVQPAQQSVNVRVGQTLSIPLPFDADAWSVDYASNILELLDPSKASRPGPQGWRFRALARGETDVALTEVSAVAPGGAPPAPRRFVITVRVTN